MNIFKILQKASNNALVVTILSFIVCLFFTKSGFTKDKFEKHVKISPVEATIEIDIPCGEDKWFSNTCEVTNAKEAKLVLLDNDSSEYIKVSIGEFKKLSYGSQRYVYCIQISPFAPKAVYPIRANLEVSKGDDTKEIITIEHNIKVDSDVDNFEDLDFHVRCVEYYNNEIKENLKNTMEALGKAAKALDKMNKASLDDLMRNPSLINASNQYNRQAGEFQDMAELNRVKSGICFNHLLWFTKSPNQETRKKALESIEKLKVQEKSDS